MRSTHDYRLNTRISLQIMKDQRLNLYDKCLSCDLTLYTGLHEPNSNIRTLYYECTVLDWLDSHWAMLQEILSSHPEYPIDQKKQITVFFAKFFAEMIDEARGQGIVSKLHSVGFLKAREEILRILISTSERWDEQSRRLRLEMKKSSEKYKKMIAEYECMNKSANKKSRGNCRKM